MKTIKKWSIRFLSTKYIAIDEPGVDEDYGTLTDLQRQHLFDQLKANNSNRRYGQIKRSFDQFYDETGDGDVLVLGFGQTSKFNVIAIVRLKGKPYFHPSTDSEDLRHRIDYDLIWHSEPFEVQEWGWANRLEKMDTPDRLKQFISLHTDLAVYNS